MDFIYWAKNLLIFRAVYWGIRNLWWVFVIVVFWPQIEDYLENFELWWELKWAFFDFVHELNSWSIWHWLLDGIRSIWDFLVGLFNTIVDAIRGSDITIEESARITGERLSEAAKMIEYI